MLKDHVSIETVQDESLSHKATVRINKIYCDELINNKLLEVAQKAAIPGYRKGKVPVSVLRKKYGQGIAADVMQELIKESAELVIGDLSLSGFPEVSQVKDDNGLEFVISYIKTPEFEMPDFTKFNQHIMRCAPSAEDIKQHLENMRSESAKYLDCEESEVLKSDMAAKINLVGKVTDTGEPFPNEPIRGLYYKLSDTILTSAFSDSLVGKKAGDTFSVNVDFTSAATNPNLVGKKVDFEIEVVSVHTVRYQSDQELAESEGYESVEQMKEDIAKKIAQDKDETSMFLLRIQLLKFIDENVEMRIPSALISKEVRSISNEIDQSSLELDLMEGAEHEEGASKAIQVGAEDQEHCHEHGEECDGHHHHTHRHHDDKPHDHKKVTTSDDQGEYSIVAKRRVKSTIVIKKYAKENNISVNQDDVHRAIVEKLSSMPPQIRSLMVKRYYSSRDAYDRTYEHLLYSKSMDHLVQSMSLPIQNCTIQELESAIESAVDELKLPGSNKKIMHY